MTVTEGAAPFPERWWARDVALELWVDAQDDPVVIRLEGTLDGSTAPDLLAIVDELIDEGVRGLELRTPKLDVKPSGLVAIRDLERRARLHGVHIGRMPDRPLVPTGPHGIGSLAPPGAAGPGREREVEGSGAKRL